MFSMCSMFPSNFFGFVSNPIFVFLFQLNFLFSVIVSKILHIFFLYSNDEETKTQRSEIICPRSSAALTVA